MQYTIRQVPKAVDKALRARAKAEGKSLNQLAIEGLSAAAGIAGNGKTKMRDLSFMAGSWTPEDQKNLENVRKMFDVIDEDLCR